MLSLILFRMMKLQERYTMYMRQMRKEIFLIQMEMNCIRLRMEALVQKIQ